MDFEAALADTALLQSLSTELMGEQDIGMLYDKIVDAATRLMHSEFASMQMLYPERGAGGELRLLAFRGFNPQAAQFWEWVRADSESTCGAALRTGTRVIASDVETCAFMAGSADLETYLQTGIHAVQTTPLVSRQGRIVGMISTHWREPHEPAPRALALLDILARQAADLIERTQAEEALRRRSAQFETLLNQAPLGVYLVDADLRIREVNPIARPVFGDLPDLIGRDLDEVMHTLWAKDYADEVVRIFRHTLDTGEPYQTPEQIRRRRDRQTDEYYEWRIDRILLPEGRHGVVCYFRDISEQVLAKRALQEADRRKDEFIAMLAHELRNPLSAITMGVELLKRVPMEDPKARFALPAIERQTRQLRQLTADLLDMARVTHGKLELRAEPLNLLELAKSTLADCAAGHTGAAISAAGEAVWVHADETRVRQMIENLLDNAVKYGGRNIALRVDRDGAFGRLAVQDDGAGLRPELLKKLFQPFVQGEQSLDREHGGLGLGLALVERLASLHGGAVEARSAGPGMGSTFTILLPPAARPAMRGEAPRAPAIARRRVLIVEDEEDSRESLRLLLEGDGHEVSYANSGSEGLARLESFRAEVALVDVGLSGMDGYEVARRVRRLSGGESILLIALTGYGGEGHRRRAQEAGFDVHLTKPVSYENLLRAFITAPR